MFFFKSKTVPFHLLRTWHELRQYDLIHSNKVAHLVSALLKNANRIIMNLIDTLYNEHTELLQSKGFDEQVMGSPFRQKGFFDELRHHIGVIINSIPEDELPNGFTLKTIGSFKDDLVQFNLHYQYDASIASLDIYQLDVFWGAHQARFKLKSSQDLLGPQDAFTQLVKEVGVKKNQGKSVRVNIPRENKRGKKKL